MNDEFWREHRFLHINNYIIPLKKTGHAKLQGVADIVMPMDKISNVIKTE